MDDPVPSNIGEELSRLVLKYAEAVNDIVRGVREGVRLLGSMRTGEAMESLASAIKADTKADDIRREILLKLRQAKSGYVRERIAKLVRRLDLVSEQAKEAARDLTIIPYLELPAELKEIVDELSDEAEESAHAMIKSLRALMVEDVKSALKYARKVEVIEEKADEIFLKGKRLVIKFGTRIKNPAVIIMFVNFMQSLENITDYAEDAGDYIRTLAIRDANEDK